MDRAGLDKDSGSGNDKGSSSTTNAGDVHGRPASSEPTTSPKRSRVESHQDAASVSATRTRRRSDNAQYRHIDKHAQHAQQQAPQPQAPKSIASTHSTQDANRRRQWSQTMLDILQDLSLVLAPDGSIVWAPRTTKALLGFEPERLIGERFPDFIRPDEVAHFVHQFKESIDQQVDLYHNCHVRKADGEYKCLEMSGRPHYEEVMDPETGTQMHALRCFFLNARPHPSRAAQALDTFFDIKVENELLRQKLKQLGVMDEDLSEMGVPSEGLMRQTDPVDATYLPAGPQQRAQEVLSKNAGSRATHSSSGPTAIEQSAAVPFDGNLAQTLEWQQQQQFYGPSSPPMLTRDSPAASDFLVSSFLRPDHLGPDVGSAGLSGQMPTQLPGSASYFYEIGAPSPDLGSMPLVTSTSQAQSSAQAAQESQFLGYQTAVQQQQHVPPSQDFHPFQTPETYSVGLFGPPELPEPSTYLMQPSSSQRRDLLGMHQMQPQQQQHRPQQQSHPSNDSMPSQQTQQSHGSQQQQQKPNRVQDSPALHAARVLSNQVTLTFSDTHTTSPTTDQSHGFNTQSSVQMHKSGNALHSPAKTTKKLKKMRPDGDEYVCTDCGTTDSPEWRRGPRGAKTLCNACGLRFAKIQKKAGSDTLTHHPAQAQQQQQSHAGDYGHLPETRAAHTRRSSTSTAGD